MCNNDLKNECHEEHNGGSFGLLVVVVLYILLAIIFGSFRSY